MRSTVYRILAAVFAVIAFLEGLDHALESAAPHRIHLLGHSVVSVALVLALLTQVLPSRVPAGLHLVAAVGVGALVGDVAGERFGGLEVVCAVFLGVLLAVHPQRGEVLARDEAVDPVWLALGVVALLAVAPYFVHQSGLQRTSIDPVHPDYGYWSWAATAPLVLALTLVVAAVRTRGWQVLVVVATVGFVVLGAVSVVLRHEPSTLGVVGGAAAVLGGLAAGATGVSRRTVRVGGPVVGTA